MNYPPGSQPRIVLDNGEHLICTAAGTPHAPHSNAVWLDWNTAEVWECPGQ